MVRNVENRLAPYFAALELERRLTAPESTFAPSPRPKDRGARWRFAWRTGLVVVLAWLAWETRHVATALETLSAVQAAQETR